jgi:hypothetical protein
MRYWCLPLLFEIEIPNVTIHKSDDEPCAQDDQRCANVIPPGGLHSINGDGRVKRQRQAEKPKQQPKAHPCPPL